jgi:hypothetical protein
MEYCALSNLLRPGGKVSRLLPITEQEVPMPNPTKKPQIDFWIKRMKAATQMETSPDPGNQAAGRLLRDVAREGLRQNPKPKGPLSKKRAP